MKNKKYLVVVEITDTYHHAVYVSNVEDKDEAADAAVEAADVLYKRSINDKNNCGFKREYNVMGVIEE